MCMGTILDVTDVCVTGLRGENVVRDIKPRRKVKQTKSTKAWGFKAPSGELTIKTINSFDDVYRMYGNFRGKIVEVEIREVRKRKCTGTK